MSKAITKQHFESLSIADVSNALKQAQDRLWQENRSLFLHDAHERSICARLAFYLTQELPHFDVDVEYNKNHADTQYQKRLYGDGIFELIRGQNRTGEEDGIMILPDIIVHVRDTPMNLLVIEAKKSSSRIDECKDLAKLKACKEELEYKFAYFVRFAVGSNIIEGGIEEGRFI